MRGIEAHRVQGLRRDFGVALINIVASSIWARLPKGKGGDGVKERRFFRGG